MNELRSQLTQFLRYGCGGGIFLVALAISSYPIECLLQAKVSGAQISLLTLLALILGVVFYAIHRALIYPIPMRSFQKWLARNDCPEQAAGWCCEISPLEYQLNLSRWQRREGTSKLQRNLDMWGSESHFLYVMTWAIWSGLILAYIYDGNATHGVQLTLLVVSAVSFLGALVHDKRCIEMDMKILKDEKTVA